MKNAWIRVFSILRAFSKVQVWAKHQRHSHSHLSPSKDTSRCASCGTDVSRNGNVCPVADLTWADSMFDDSDWTVVDTLCYSKHEGHCRDIEVEWQRLVSAEVRGR